MRRPPVPEYLDIHCLAPDQWVVGSESSALKATDDESAAEAICKAFVQYYDNVQNSQLDL